ncbi:MAG: DUF6766 family protein [Candidatus Limnocylindrales bacterium]
MKRRLVDNGLSITMGVLFLVALAGQIYTGSASYNQEQVEHGETPADIVSYLTTAHFTSALFENWESEFLQMGLFVALTVFLRQKGSPESKPEGKSEIDREPDPGRRGAPWPVRAGGLIGKVYENSLSLALFALFGMSFVLHLVTSASHQTAERLAHGEAPATVLSTATDPTFWFESFQNWQSEFLSVAVLAVLAIFLRQKGSPESKPVDAPDSETG